MRRLMPALLPALLIVAACSAHAGSALCPGTPLPVQGAAIRGSAPLLPADNWWNLDIRQAPVDPNSAAYISFIHNGGTRRLHPDFGGQESAGSVGIYGFPVAVVDGSQAKAAVNFLYRNESDGVDRATGQPLPFYPIPLQAVTQPHWVEGGAPASVDQRSGNDRHLLMVDCTNNHLYELYNLWYDTAAGRWHAGSGAFFDLNSNARRPEGWTSADAAGLAILPGLVRYDEVYNPAVAEIGHAFRVTVRATNGYVWPASHRAGSTAGALPMGARLRLKALVNGQDPALRTQDPGVQKIFRAMQKHGLIVADNGSDLYVSGTFDTRWNNSILNPAFRLLNASDFEVVQLGWKPVAASSALAQLSLSPSELNGGSGGTGTVVLNGTAPAGGAVVALQSSQPAVAGVPQTVTVPQGASSASFTIGTQPVTAPVTVTLAASWQQVTRSATLTVKPAAPSAELSRLSLASTRVYGGNILRAVVRLSAPAPAGGLRVNLSSSLPAVASVPATLTVPAGATRGDFSIRTVPVSSVTPVTIGASAGGRTLSAGLSVRPR